MKRTFQPKPVKRKKVHGFLARKKAGTGIVARRRLKGRQKLTA